jgi:hypothetical protein
VKSLQWLFVACLIGGCAYLLAVAAFADDESGSSATIPRGTIVPILVVKDVRVGGLYGESQEEHKIKLRVAQDVIVGGYIVAKTGDVVDGHYDTRTNITRREFSSNSSVELTLDVDDAVNFCGDTIHLEFERTYLGGARAGTLSFGWHSHDAVFAKGSILKASTDRREKALCADKTTAAPAPLPSGMVVPDDEVSPAPSSSP